MAAATGVLGADQSCGAGGASGLLAGGTLGAEASLGDVGVGILGEGLERGDRVGAAAGREHVGEAGLFVFRGAGLLEHGIERGADLRVASEFDEISAGNAAKSGGIQIVHEVAQGIEFSHAAFTKTHEREGVG